MRGGWASRMHGRTVMVFTDRAPDAPAVLPDPAPDRRPARWAVLLVLVAATSGCTSAAAPPPAPRPTPDDCPALTQRTRSYQEPADWTPELVAAIEAECRADLKALPGNPYWACLSTATTDAAARECYARTYDPKLKRAPADAHRGSASSPL